MSNYSVNPNICRVDFFKLSGKWYTTEAVEFLDQYYDSLPQDAFKEALKNHFKDNPTRLSGMTAVCLEPYVSMPHPLSIVNIN